MDWRCILCGTRAHLAAGAMEHIRAAHADSWDRMMRMTLGVTGIRATLPDALIGIMLDSWNLNRADENGFGPLLASVGGPK